MAGRGVSRYLTRMDVTVLVAVLVIALAVQAVLMTRSRPGSQVLVSREGKVLFRGALGEQQLVRLQGPLGETLLQIDAEGASVTASPCPYKVCMAMGKVSRSGEVIACVPNRLLVVVAGDNRDTEQDYDLISR